MFIASNPLMVRRAVLNEPKLMPGLTLSFDETMVLFD